MTDTQKAVNACGNLLTRIRKAGLGTPNATPESEANFREGFFSCFGAAMADYMLDKLIDTEYNPCDFFLLLDQSNAGKFVAFYN